MSELFLVAHKVRGEATFDVAERMLCPECQGNSSKGREPYVCFECDDLGYWWIIPTSGHRAYPLVTWELSNLLAGDTGNGYMSVTNEAGPLEEHPHFETIQDHYKCGPAPKLDIRSLFKAQQKPTIQRRF